MMKIPNCERYVFVLKSNPFKLHIIIFFKFLYLGDFVVSRLTSNDELEIVFEGFKKLKTLQFLHGFQFLALDIIVGYAVHFVN